MEKKVVYNLKTEYSLKIIFDVQPQPFTNDKILYTDCIDKEPSSFH